jgi:hypothetical protein
MNIIAKYKYKLVIVQGSDMLSHGYVVPNSTVDYYERE